ncbi:MAG: PIG-L deacetylase family protein [Pyrinomonadaceae bacterium]
MTPVQHVSFDDLRQVVFISPHPDDVELCCGILVRRLVRAGVGVHYLCVTDGAPAQGIAVDLGSLPGDYNQRAYKLTRRRESLTALDILGVAPSDVRFLDYPDLGTLNHIDSIVEDFGAALQNVDAVFCCPFEGGHPDHDLCRFALGVAADRIAYAGGVFEYASYNSHGYQVFLRDAPPPFTLSAEPDEERIQRRVAQAFLSQREMASHFNTHAECFRRGGSVFNAADYLTYSEAPEYEQFAFPASRLLDKIREYLSVGSEQWTRVVTK